MCRTQAEQILTQLMLVAGCPPPLRRGWDFFTKAHTRAPLRKPQSAAVQSSICCSSQDPAIQTEEMCESCDYAEPSVSNTLATEIWFLAGKNCFFSNGVARYQLAEDLPQCFCNCFWYLHQSITKQVIYIHPSAFWKHQPRLCIPISEACTTARQPLVYLPVLWTGHWTRDLHHQLRWGQ